MNTREESERGKALKRQQGEFKRGDLLAEQVLWQARAPQIIATGSLRGASPLFRNLFPPSPCQGEGGYRGMGFIKIKNLRGRVEK